MRALRFLLPVCIGLVFPFITGAQVITCPIPGLPCGQGGAQGAVNFVLNTVVPQLRIIFGGVLLAFSLYYAIRLLAESGDDSVLTETKQAYGYAVVGAGLVMLSGAFVAAVNVDNTPAIVDSAPVVDALSIIVIFMRWTMGVLVTAFLAIQGARLILLQGQEAETAKQKMRFFHALLGVAAIIMANALVSAAIPGNGVSALGGEAKALANLLLEVFGFLVFVTFVLAGIFMVLSTNEELKDRAKKMVFAAIISLIVVFSIYMIINFVLTDLF